jgi:hypothetical protein
LFKVNSAGVIGHPVKGTLQHYGRDRGPRACARGSISDTPAGITLSQSLATCLFPRTSFSYEYADR